MSAGTTRRALLGAIAVVPIVALPAETTDATVSSFPKSQKDAASDASAWRAALATYRAKRAYSDALPLGHPEEDNAIDAYCEAFDQLMETPAPTGDALALKIEMAHQRCDGLGFFDNYIIALAADARRLGGL